MKATLLIVCGLTSLLFGGCETDLPSNPSQPTVSFGNNRFRDEGVERPAGPAMDRDRNNW
jgi:hypothetical protein